VQLNIQPGVQLSWPTPNTTIPITCNGHPVPVQWTDLVAAITGDGTTHTLLDLVPVGSRLYQDLEIVPGTPRLPHFLRIADSNREPDLLPPVGPWIRCWRPVYGVRTNDSPHSGSFNFQVHLASVGAGPLVQFNQAGVPVTGGTTYPFSLLVQSPVG